MSDETAKPKRRRFESLSRDEVAQFSGDVRAGIKTDRQLAAEWGVSHTTIQGWRTKLGIEPDLAQRIAEKAASKVAKAEVAKEVASDLATEAQIVEVNATAVANVILSHRGDIKRGRGVVASMLYELELECGPENAELLGQLGELMREPDENGQDKRNELYQKIISLPGRAKTMKDLGESLTKLIAAERQAFGIDKSDGDKPATTFNLQF